MGYRSEWQLRAAGTSENISELLDWMFSQTTEDRDEQFWWHEIRARASLRKPEGFEAGLFVEGKYDKCGDAWHRVTHAILVYGREQLGLDMAVARLGDLFEDRHFDNGDAVEIDYIRSLAPCDWPEV